MEYLPSQDVFEALRKRGKPFRGLTAEKRVSKWIYQLADALDFMHSCGYMHRDIKPENMYVFWTTVSTLVFVW